MGIAQHRHPIGRERQELLDRIRDAGRRLVRQPVENVGIEAHQPAVTQILGQALGELEALLPADGLLDQGVEVLHPDRDAGHAGLEQGIEARGIDLGRIDFDREVRLGIGRHRIADRQSQLMDQRGRQERGRAPAPVHPRQSHARSEPRPQERELGFEGCGISAHGGVRTRPLSAAGAEPAEPATERDMEV